MERLRRLAEKVASLNQNQTISKAIDSDVLNEVVRLNTDEQLFQGIDSVGRDLSSVGGEYTHFTKRVKQLKGQPTDRVTLLDEGDFYNSFKASRDDESINIDADYSKPGIDLRERWGEELPGLTPENIEALNQDFLIPNLRAILLQLNQ